MDTSFLKEGTWKESNVPYDQLVKMFEDEYKTIKEANPDLPEEDVVEEAQEGVTSIIASLKKGGAVVGKGVSFGISPPNNYVVTYGNIQVSSYKKLCDSKGPITIKDVDGKGNIKTYNKPEEMVADKLIKVLLNSKTGEKRIIPLEKRSDPEHPDNPRNKLRGQMYPESSYMSNFIAYWEASINNKKYLLESLLGGEGDDTALNPVCPECGKPSLSRICQNTKEIIIDGHKKRVPCTTEIVENGIKKIVPTPRTGFLIPTIMESCGTLSTFSMKMVTNEDKTLKSIDFPETPNLSVGEKLSIKMEYIKDADGKIHHDNGKAKKIFTGSLMNWIPSDRIINCKMIWDTWSKDEIMLRKPAVELWNKFGFHPVFFFCTLYQINKKMIFGNCRAWGIDDSKVDDKDEGLLLTIPSYVYEYQVKNKIGEKSIVLVVGMLSRTQAKDFVKKIKKFKEVKISKNGKERTEKVPIYTKPSISVSCIIPIITRLSKTDVDEKKIDVGPLESKDDEKIIVKEETLSEADIKKAQKELAKFNPETTEDIEEIEESSEAEESEDESDEDETPATSDTNEEPIEDIEDESEGDVTETKPAKPEEAPEEIENLDNISEVVTPTSSKGNKKKGRFKDVD